MKAVGKIEYDFVAVLNDPKQGSQTSAIVPPASMFVVMEASLGDSLRDELRWTKIPHGADP